MMGILNNMRLANPPITDRRCRMCLKYINKKHYVLNPKGDIFCNHICLENFNKEIKEKNNV
jgi:hypothetical protein